MILDWPPGWPAWAILGFLLMAAELVLPGVFLVWIGAAAVATALLVWLLEPTLLVALAMHMVLLALAIGLSMQFLKPRGDAVTHGVNRPHSGLLGRSGVVVSGDGTQGRVRVGDSDWPCRMRSANLHPGDHVSVTGVEGMTLLVAPLRHGP
jgi:membrane protein implicated in regulation of membrane protease activity